MSMITSEFNYSRKAQRVNVPLLVQFGNKVYKAIDWSMTGVGVLAVEEDVEVGQKIKARLVLPVPNASISLEVNLECRNIRGDITGFEFSEMSQKHRRVLRHYIELAMEGKLEHIEDLISDFSSPDIETPIKEALNLTEEEQSSLLKKFRSRAFLTMTAGICLFLYIIFTFLYNSVFVYKTVGVVLGDIVQIKAGATGSLKKQYVKVGDLVQKNEIIFELDDSRLLERLRKTQQVIEKQTNLRENFQRHFVQEQSSSLLQSLKEAMQNGRKELDNAISLQEQGVISRKDLQFVKNNYIRSRTAYMREAEARSNTRALLEEKSNLINLKIDLAINEKQQILQELEALRIKSPTDGSIFTLNYHEGEHVESLDVVMTIATHSNPFILFKVPSEESSRTQLGATAKIYSFETNKTYSGKISSIGYNAINPRSTFLQEVSLEQTVIRVDFLDQNMQIPLNSRVEVWLQRPLPFFDRLVEKIKEQFESDA